MNEDRPPYYYRHRRRKRLERRLRHIQQRDGGNWDRAEAGALAWILDREDMQRDLLLEILPQVDSDVEALDPGHVCGPATQCDVNRQEHAFTRDLARRIRDVLKDRR